MQLIHVHMWILVKEGSFRINAKLVKEELIAKLSSEQVHPFVFHGTMQPWRGNIAHSIHMTEAGHPVVSLF